MKRGFLAIFAAAVALAVGVLVAPSEAQRAAPTQVTCSAGYVDGVIGGQHKCLRAGEFCSASYEADYERYGFSCVDGHLNSGVSAPATTSTSPPPATTTSAAPPPAPASTTTSSGGGSYPDVPILLKTRTKSSGCTLGPLPDRRCSPGAYSKSLTKAVICSASFRTGSVRNVSTSTRHQVEQEYGLAPKSYGSSLEIDHIVSLELGGSNNIANLFPEKATLPNHQPGFRVKDKLENAAHDAVCNGTITLSYAQHQIAANWELLYKRLFGVLPTGQ
jgi:hypothetical protein